MFLIVLVVVVVGWAIVSLVTWQGLRLTHIDVRGASRVNPDLVRTTARLPKNGNIWLINPWALHGRIEAIPYVASVHLQRAFPNRVTLVVQERSPESCIATPAGLAMIDATQRVLERGCRTPLVYDVPQIKTFKLGQTLTDSTLARLRADVATMQAAHLQVAHASFDRDGGLTCMTRNGVALLLGEDATLAATVALVNPIFAAVQKQGRAVSQVDLRASATPVVRYKDSSATTVKSKSGA